MANKTSYTNVEGLVPLKGNSNKFIGIKNNQLQAISNEELLDSFNISQRIPFSVNTCSDTFIKPYGIISSGNEITLYPMKLMDSSNTIEINLTETLTKNMNLFAEGNNQGCKDNSYTKWQQPVMTGEYAPYGHCFQSQGTMTSAPYMAMDGIIDSSLNQWLASTINSTWIYTNTNPIIVESLYLHNTNTANRSRDLDIFINEDINQKILENYVCSPDVYDINYINIPAENRIESSSIGILVKTAFAGTTVGFTEIEINAKTKYVQPNTYYNVFLITNKEQTKVDFIITTDKQPIMPSGFEDGYYAYVKQVQTDLIYNIFETSLGDGLVFDISRPLTITDCNNQTTIITNELPIIKFNDTDLTKEIIHTVYCKSDGTIYDRTAKFYKNLDSLPTAYQIGEVAFITGNYANGKAFEWDGENWIDFNDVPICEVYRYNNKSIAINQFPCNNNFYIKSLQNDVWIHEETMKLGFNYIIPHNLNIEDISDYKFDCQMLCIQADAGYLPGELAMCPTLVFNATNNIRNIQPYLTKNYIGLMSGTVNTGFWVVNKTRGYAWDANLSCWKLIFRIWK